MTDFSVYKPRIQALIDDITRDLRAERVSIEIEVQTGRRASPRSPHPAAHKEH
jgi:hypothetical protein